jgi:two-component system response regulator CpxR
VLTTDLSNCRIPISLLLIDDDIGLCGLMKEFFIEQQMEVETANDGRSGLALALSRRFNLVLLDVMLPAMDGFQVLREIRRKSSVPVIMLTARIGGADRVAGLETGADDYLPKPFDPDELLARVRAVLRRVDPAAGPAKALLRVGVLEIDGNRHEASIGGNDLALTAMEFHILDILARAPGRIVSREEISAALHQREPTAYERSLEVHISHLRKKIEARGPAMIKTIRGAGYLLGTGDSR